MHMDTESELRMKNDGTWDWYHDDEQFEEHYEFDIQTVGEDYTCDMVTCIFYFAICISDQTTSHVSYD